MDSNLLITADENGEKLVVLPQIIFRGKRTIPWDDKDYGEKHKSRAQKGRYRYDTRFAMPVINENGKIEKYNVFRAVLIVRIAADGRMYLYDIQNIKKERNVQPTVDQRPGGQKPASFKSMIL